MSEDKRYITNTQSKINNEFVYNWLKQKFPKLIYEKLSDKGECLVFVQEKPGVIERTYFGNLSILSQSYSIYLFTDGTDTRSRINANKLLQEISDYVELSSKMRQLPTLSDKDKAVRLEVSMPAYLADRDEQGYTYHLEITMTYESRK